MENILEILDGGMRAIAFTISTFVYRMIFIMYGIFDRLCSTHLFEEEVLKIFIDRISVVLGIVMLFIVIFSFIKMLVDPDKINDKEFGAVSVIKKSVIVIVMLGLSNFAFRGLYFLQDVVIEDDLISKILLPVRIDEKQSSDFGKVLTEELFSSFYRVDSIFENNKTQTVTYCENTVNQFKNQIISDGNFALGRECLTKTEKIDGANVFIIDYNYIFSLLVGCVVLYLLFSYCISVGIRMIQLLFLEIISPMAIVSYLMPKKETMFGRWGKMYISTYIDVFIRIVIIDFIVFIIAAIFKSHDFIAFWNSFSDMKGEGVGILKVIIIIALLTFAKKAPDLLKALFPNTPDSKLGFGPSMSGFAGIGALFGGLAGGAIGATGALVRGAGNTGKAVGLLKNGWNKEKTFAENLKANKNNLKGLGKAFGGGILGVAGVGVAGLARGGFAGKGAKGIGGALKAGQQAQAKANVADSQRIARGISMKERAGEASRRFVGMSGAYEAADLEFNKYSRTMGAISSVPCNKDVKEQSESIKQNVAIDRNKSVLKYVQKLNSMGLDKTVFTRSDDVTKDLIEAFEQKFELDNKTNRSAEETKVLATLQRDLKSKLGEDYEKYSNAFILKKENDILEQSYIQREMDASKMCDDMQDAVFCLAKYKLNKDKNPNIASEYLEQLKNIEGFNADYDNDGNIKTCRLGGIKVTDWDSVGAEIEMLEKSTGKPVNSIADIKKRMGEASTAAVYASDKKNSS